MSKITTCCTSHCSACGLHFHSLHAFDAHRQGDYASNDPELGRHCVHPFDLDGKLVVLTEAGECRMYDDGRGGAVSAGVTIWTHGRDLTRMRERVAAGGLAGAESPSSEGGST